MTYIYYNKDGRIKMFTKEPIAAGNLSQAIVSDAIIETSEDAIAFYKDGAVVYQATEEAQLKNQVIAEIGKAKDFDELKTAIIKLLQQ
jgi:hypothetical protein